MARRAAQADPVLEINYFSTGFYSYRNPLFAPVKSFGVNLVSLKDSIIAGANLEVSDILEVTRRPGYSIFCTQPLDDNEIVREFYSSRLLTGAVVPWVDTSERLAIFSPTTITTVVPKTTTSQGYPITIGNMTYFSDGAAADYSKYDSTNLSVWGLAAPTVAPISSGMGFWQPKTSYGPGNSLLDTNGNIESLSSVVTANGTVETPTTFSNLPLAGSNPSITWSQFSSPPSYQTPFQHAFGSSSYLFLESSHFNIPVTAAILGIQVTIWKQSVGGSVADESVKLVIGGAVVGTEHAEAGNWSGSGFAPVTYGGPTDLWGTTPTAAQINTNGPSGFGVAIASITTSTPGGDLRSAVSSNLTTITIYYQPIGPDGAPGISGANEPNWPTNISVMTPDGSISWTNYGPILTWYPSTYYPTPVVILDPNGNLQLGASLNNVVPEWSNAISYSPGQFVTFGGSFWVSVFTSVIGVPPSSVGATATTSGGTTITTPYWVVTQSPIVTGALAPVWNTIVGGITQDFNYTWENIGQGTALAFTGYEYVYGFRTIYGHLTTASPFSNNTGAILGPVNGAIASFSITSNVATFTGVNNFIVGNVFEVEGLTTPVGLLLDGQSFTVTSAVSSETFPLTSVSITANVLTVQAFNNLVAGQQVTFSGVGSATFLNGQTVTVLAGGLSGTQFEANFTHADYGPTGDTGNVNVIGSWTAVFTHADVASTMDAGSALPLISTISGVGTGSPLSNSVATITSVSITADIVQITASNNFQPGIWVTLTGLTGATFLNGQQFQVIAVDQPIGTQNTWFQVYFVWPNYISTADTGTATFNAVEIYRISDGGGTYLFDGAVTNPGAGLTWTFNDFVIDADLDILLIAPLAHQNDPPPGAPGSLYPLTVGTISAYWNGRLWLAVGNYVYFDAGPDCTNGIPEESWPPGNRFQFSGPVLGLQPMQNGAGLIVYLADRVRVILGGPETISFYPDDFLENFGISNPNALFKDGSVLGQFTTQKQYFEMLGANKNEIGERISDYLTANFLPVNTYVTSHRDGLDVGTFLSNGVDRILRYGSNIGAWSVPAFPLFGAGALRSVETSVGVFTLMLGTPNGGTTNSNPQLGAAGAYGLLAWSGITNTGGTVITGGNIGSAPTATITGFPPGTVVAPGTIDNADAMAAHTAAVAAYAYYSGLTFTSLGTAVNLATSGNGVNTHTYVAGNYSSTSSFDIPNTFGGIVLDAQGNTNAQFVFFSASTTTLEAGSSIILINGAKAVNVIWIVGSSFVSVATSTMVGTILAQISVTLGGGSLTGRAIAGIGGSSGAVTISAATAITVTGNGPTQVGMGNYLYARDINSWGDGGLFGKNNGTPYPDCECTIGSITLSPLGGLLLPLQHICLYAAAVGTLHNGGPSYPDLWVLPNEILGQGVNEPRFVYLPEVLSEPPEGTAHPSATLLALRYPINMVNSYQMSQFIANLQVKVRFEPEMVPNSLKALSFKQDHS